MKPTTKPASSPVFPSIILTAAAAELISTLATACSQLGAESDPAEVDRRYGEYVAAKHALCAYVESIEDQAESVVNHPQAYTRIRF